MSDILKSKFVIDGVAQEFTPLQMLGSELPAEGQVVDESTDPSPLAPELSEALAPQYLSAIKALGVSPVSTVFPEADTRLAISTALIDSLWGGEHTTFDSLSARLCWRWPVPGAIGDMSALYSSVQAAADFTCNLGLPLAGFSAEPESERHLQVQVLHEGQPVSGRTCPAKADTSLSDSWIVFIPFDTCDFRLGGSALLASKKATGTIAPAAEDADYFLDSYEVVRELVQDKVALAGATIGRGGLYKALQQFCGGRFDINGIASAYPQCSVPEILFSEVPGALIQISDADFDYLDAELLLQDVAFYPLGHPSEGCFSVAAEPKSGIDIILDALIQNVTTEGED